jgi:MFS family permease
VSPATPADPGRRIVLPGVARSFDRRLVLLINMVPLALALIQISSVNVGLHSISQSLGAQSSDLQWVLSGYALAFGITLVPAGRLGDAAGRGSVFVVGLGLFALASLACGLAPTPLLLNLARVCQGLGAGLQGPQTTGLIQQYFSGQARARAYALSGMVVAASVAVGPVMTGSLIKAVGPELGWRLPFLINCPLGLLGCVCALRWLPFESERARRRAKAASVKGATAGARRERLELDPVGAALLTGAVVSLMLPNMLGQQVGAERFWLLSGVVLGGGLWLWWEARHKARGRVPMVDLSLFQIKSFARQTLVSALNFLGMTSVFVVLLLLLQRGLGWEALPASLIGLPNAILSCAGAIWAGRQVLAKRDWLIVISLLAIVAGVLSTAGVVYLVWRHGLSPWWLMATLALSGLGQGMFGAANQTLSMLDVPVAMAGVAGGVKSMAERCSTAVGNAIMTGVLFSLQPVAGWPEGVIAAYAGVAAAVLAALGLAWAFALRAAAAGRR